MPGDGEAPRQNWLHKLRARFLFAKPFIDVIVPILLAILTFATLLVYRELANVSERQLQLEASQNAPMFEGGMEITKNPDTGIYDTDRLAISNVGAPVVVTGVSSEYVINVELDPKNLGARNLVKVYTTSFYGAEFLHSSTTGEVFSTAYSRNRGRVFDLYKLLLAKGFQDNFAFLSSEHYLAISYVDRAHESHTEYYRVDDFGMRDSDEVSWRRLMAAVDTARTGDLILNFDRFSPNRFMSILSKLTRSK